MERCRLTHWTRKFRLALASFTILSFALLLLVAPQSLYSAESLDPFQVQSDEFARYAPQTAGASDDAAYALQPLAVTAQDQAQTGPSYIGMNPAQALRILFSPEGVDVRAQAEGDLAWNLGLQVVGYGHGSEAGGGTTAPSAATASVVNRNRIDYAREELVEWFINDAQGLKQGFTLAEPPRTGPLNGPLQVRLRVVGMLQPNISADGQVIDFVTPQGAALLRYDALLVFDAQQRTLPAHFVAIAGGIAIEIDDRDAIYPLTIDPLLSSYLSKHTAADGAANDFLGYDVNISQRVAIVGAYGDDNERGAVYFYGRTNGSSGAWQEIAQITADDGAPGDQFGKDVYITFGITATVGAPGDDDKGQEAGATYLFSRDFGGSNTWGKLAKLTANDGTAGDGFGSAVATQLLTSVIGAPGHDALGNDAGAVYIFELLDPAQPTIWTQTKKLTAPDGVVGDLFGVAVVVSGDIIAVGAPGDDDACPQNPNCDSGAVYIFERDRGGPNQWGLRIKRTAADASAGARLGSSINFSTERIIAGAPGDSQIAPNAGAAYIFDRYLYGIDTWAQRPKLVAPDGAANDEFGRAVGIGGNIAIIGAPFDDDNGENSGSAYLAYFRLIESQADSDRIVKLITPEGKANDHFGFSVDQRSGEIVTSAPQSDSAAANAGAVYFYAAPFKMGTLQLTNNVEPNAPASQWNYSVQGQLSHTDSAVGDSQTVPVVLFPGVYTVTQSAGANTTLSQYSTTWACTIGGDPGPSGNGVTFRVTVGPDQSVRCGFTHNQAGSITIQKQTKPAGGVGFNFVDNITAPNSFTLNDGGDKRFADLKPGIYQIRETVGAEWRLTAIECMDPDGGTQTSGTTAFIDLGAGEAVVCTFVNKARQGISVLLTTNVATASVGESIIYTYRIINDSPIALDEVVVTDDRFGNIALSKTTLAANEEVTATVTYTVVVGDLPSPLRNTVNVSGATTEGEVTDSTSVAVNLLGIPNIALAVKTDPARAGVEDVITFTYLVTNTGSTALANVRIGDSQQGAVNLVDSTLEAGESTTSSLTYVVVETDLPGPITRTVTVRGTASTGAEVSREVTVSIPLKPNQEEPPIEPQDRPRLFLPNIQ